MSKKYDLLILDYGGVYSFEYDPASAATTMLKTFGRQPNETEAKKLLDLSRLLGANKIDVDTYLKQGSEVLSCSLPITKEFEKTVVSFGFPPSPAMVALVKKVRASGVKVSLLSDMYLFELLKTRPEGRYEGFDYTSFSSEIGYTKASPEAFTATLDHFGVNPDKALFVDDIPLYVENAKAAGMDALWVDKTRFQTPEQLADTISELVSVA